MLAVAKEYEVSANYLARVCAALNVPWPPRGYWAKVAAGLAVDADRALAEQSLAEQSLVAVPAEAHNARHQRASRWKGAGSSVSDLVSWFHAPEGS